MPAAARPPAPQYGATVVALLVYAAPLYRARGSPATVGEGAQGKLTQDYIRAMRLLSNTSK